MHRLTRKAGRTYYGCNLSESDQQMINSAFIDDFHEELELEFLQHLLTLPADKVKPIIDKNERNFNAAYQEASALIKKYEEDIREATKDIVNDRELSAFDKYDYFDVVLHVNEFIKMSLSRYLCDAAELTNMKKDHPDIAQELLDKFNLDTYTNEEIDKLVNEAEDWDPWERARAWYFYESAREFSNMIDNNFEDLFCSFWDLDQAKQIANRDVFPELFDENGELIDMEEDEESDEEDSEIEESKWMCSLRMFTVDGEYVGNDVDDTGSGAPLYFMYEYYPELVNELKEEYLYGKLKRE